MNNSGIHIKPSHEGLLHRAMHVKPGEKLSVGSLMAKKKRDKKNHDVKDEREDVFALNSRKWNHDK